MAASLKMFHTFVRISLIINSQSVLLLHHMSLQFLNSVSAYISVLRYKCISIYNADLVTMIIMRNVVMYCQEYCSMLIVSNVNVCGFDYYSISFNGRRTQVLLSHCFIL